MGRRKYAFDSRVQASWIPMSVNGWRSNSSNWWSSYSRINEISCCKSYCHAPARLRRKNPVHTSTVWTHPDYIVVRQILLTKQTGWASFCTFLSAMKAVQRVVTGTYLPKMRTATFLPLNFDAFRNGQLFFDESKG